MAIRAWRTTEWPEGLRQIPEPPQMLWIRGTMPAADMKRLAVVGSRLMSRYGEEACRSLIAGLAGYPVSIVSGLALGIDATAHKAALAAGLHTIAIPGSGLDDAVIGPRANLGLAHRILESGGALLSEHEPSHIARPFDFPSRNRLMVGLADAVLIIEAGPRSGTLITARLASDYNRDLLAVPHRVGDPHGFGPHLFIRLGAALVSEPAHLLDALGIPLHTAENGRMATPDLEGIERSIWELLDEPHPRDEILRTVESEGGETMTALVSLELRGLIKEEFGAWRRA